MNKDLLESQWTQIHDALREKFRNLTEDDIRQINGQYEQLVAKLQQKYGYAREEAEERIKNWNLDLLATAPRTADIREGKTFREDRVVESDRSSFLRWLIPLAIAGLLIAGYFGMRAPEVSRPAINQENPIAQTPADRVLSDNLRNALVSQTTYDMQNVLITSQNGAVTLSGTVPNSATRDFVVSTAQTFAGVKQVIDHLQIK